MKRSISVNKRPKRFAHLVALHSVVHFIMDQAPIGTVGYNRIQAAQLGDTNRHTILKRSASYKKRSKRFVPIAYLPLNPGPIGPQPRLSTAAIVQSIKHTIGKRSVSKKRNKRFAHLLLLPIALGTGAVLGTFGTFTLGKSVFEISKAVR